MCDRFLRLIDTIDINQIGFTDFYRLYIDCQIDTDFYRWTTPGFKFLKRNKALLIYIKNITQFDIFDLDSTFYQYFPGKDYLLSVGMWGKKSSAHQHFRSNFVLVVSSRPLI